LRKATPYEEPAKADYGEVYALNSTLVTWALGLTQNVPLPDSDSLRSSRLRYTGFPNAMRPPFVTRGDQLSSSTFWHGSKMDEWANAWTRYYTGGKGNYMVCGMEDTGTLQALTFLGQAGRVDLHRVLVLRTVSNYDREPPGMSAADVQKTLQGLVGPKVDVRLGYDALVSNASPMRSDVMNAVAKAVHSSDPGTPVVPTQAAYATDGAVFRNAGIPTYGVGGVFIMDSEEFAHGLNERIRVNEFYKGLTYWDVLIRALAT